MSVRRLLAVPDQSEAGSTALLVLRLVAGTAFLFHGWGKIQNPFGWMEPGSGFPAVLQGLAALAEFGGGLAWILGLLTPLATLGIACTMAVAVWQHAGVRGDPFVSMVDCYSYEMASLFLSIALVLLTVGPGRFALDRVLFDRRPVLAHRG
jgi:putative oxidoreductase